MEGCGSGRAVLPMMMIVSEIKQRSQNYKLHLQRFDYKMTGTCKNVSTRSFRVGCKNLAAVVTKISVFWSMTPCSSLKAS
jgi:hypothetical protein